MLDQLPGIAANTCTLGNGRLDIDANFHNVQDYEEGVRNKRAKFVLGSMNNPVPAKCLYIRLLLGKRLPVDFRLFS